MHHQKDIPETTKNIPKTTLMLSLQLCVLREKEFVFCWLKKRQGRFAHWTCLWYTGIKNNQHTFLCFCVLFFHSGLCSYEQLS